ncbi:TPA: VRR-NUC domain-containing protein [Vibrio vulnificus]|uniref:VRR-NUC domain-containing protein n=1 Tax=Vibrio vulnificus TaxID=672 RepID=UPI0005F16DBA|nr:VRR-NUC domain-containing protein [Vibrio vulnificus]HAS6385900.1 VRR-NUC domain-containing protein [Vibrio vulnificus]HDY7619979.1 VRR-NUC domain-containing protein [Vibrio vulnificus]HDY7624940.1 VRR-NUC domain-containing protein [Vibrio vulnificus]HDZ3715756.1 VRR-NUC domain-containing protein [Vibrio vulnificus]HEB2782935.1 VRR-NUC domain-containing protein [Vibrio vulnificus]
MSLSLQQEIGLIGLAKGGHSQAYKNNPSKRRPILRERAEQVALVDWANKTTWNGILIGDFLTHVPNEGKRGPQAQKDFVELGGSKGYPDLILDIPTKKYPGLRIEMKAPEPYYSYVTSSQENWHEKLRAMGYRVEICNSHEAGKILIMDYLND